MNEVKIWTEETIIPTYETGQPEKNPMFIDHRVYQGSSGKVYPYPTIEKITDTKTDVAYESIYIENEYLKIMILPGLGGRIQRAYDKTNNYDFIYYNHVIKPALVGLTGPWISGGIEFNWPQHHRPTTYMPVDYSLSSNEDGSKSALLHDVDQMYGTKAITKITLYPGKAYIEITGQLYNPTALPQTFLWWANPAVPVNEHTQSVFPPDVQAVMDHGKRDVSRFPIATGTYYKKDYSDGVDISRYKNIPVPTSYMAEKSKYDFVGGFDYNVNAGILHVADHHISPGKKQWTWGCGDFGKAWDRNLTDQDGPYVELMTGVYTDNQPDFTWLKPFEEKTFNQYFMPYKGVGQVKNATKDCAVNLHVQEDEITVTVYSTSLYDDGEIIVTHGNEIIFKETAVLSPADYYTGTFRAENITEECLHVSVISQGRILVEYSPEIPEIRKLPKPAEAAKEPWEILTNEELYLTGLHIEQYRHATYPPDPYYLEGLKRDPGDIRINNAYGLLLLRRGCFEEGRKHFKKAIERLTQRNPNPYDSEAYYLLGLAEKYLGDDFKAYEAFYKAAWSSEQQEMSFYYLAAIDAKNQRYSRALAHIEKALVKNSHNIKARGLKAYILRRLSMDKAAMAWINENLALDPFDFVSANEGFILTALEKPEVVYRGLTQEKHLAAARDYAEFGAYEEGITLLRRCTKEYPLLKYYEGYYLHLMGRRYTHALMEAESYSSDYCFPNKSEDIPVLKFAAGKGKRASYYLGNLYYDKKQWEKAISLWEESVNPEYPNPTVHRNLAIGYYNNPSSVTNFDESIDIKSRAREEMEKAFKINPTDARVFFELDQLYKKLGMSYKERLEKYQANPSITCERDDLYIEYLTLINLSGDYEKAYQLIMNRKFHPWEGGEGKITGQYTACLLEMAKQRIKNKEWEKAEDFLRKALVYPENLGEGKLEGTKDNNIYYYLGIVLEGQCRRDEAMQCYEAASLGMDEPAGVMYYNDQPPHMILYQGLSKLKLGRTSEAKAKFYRLIDYGEQHLHDEVKTDYFAVSLPDFLIFKEDYTKRNIAHCYYLMALGNIGLGQTKKAMDFLQEAIKTQPSEMMIYFERELH